MLRILAKRMLRRAAGFMPFDRFVMKSDFIYILNIHGVNDQKNCYWPAISPVDFYWMIESLGRHCNFSNLQGLTQVSKKRPTVVLSFDDGYMCFKDIVYPYLQKKGIPSNLNVIGECLQSKLPPWNVELSDFLNQAPVQFFKDFGERIQKPIAIPEHDDQKELFGAWFSGFFKQRSQDQRAADLRWVKEWMQRVDFERSKMMGAEDILGLGPDVEIGNHSYSHNSMGIESDDFFIKDLESAETIIRGITGKDQKIYSFPNGSWRQSLVDELIARGYEHILLVEERPIRKVTLMKPRLTCAGMNRGTLRMRFSGLRGGRPWDGEA